MVLYLLLCLVSVLAGCGLLTAIGLDVDRRSTLFLAPVVTLCVLSIFMGGLVAGGFTIGEITPATYILCFGAAVLGAVRHGQTVLRSWRTLLIIAALPLLILLPSVVQGIENYSGGSCLDGWSYVTAGQSLQQYPLGADGWLPPAVQYSAQWGKTIRFISPAFLALLAPLSGQHNDTEEVLGHYFGWLFFVYANACFFLAKATRLRSPLAWAFLLLAMLSGWTLRIENSNSVDNALALCLLPSVLGFLILMPGPSVRGGVVLGIVLATGFYAYPESSPFTIAAILVMGAQRMIAAPGQRQEFKRMGLALVITLMVCVLPFASGIAGFFRQQFTAAINRGPKPGEGFYKLLTVRDYVLPSYWGLMPDFENGKALVGQIHSRIYSGGAFALACILTIAALLGFGRLLRRGDWSLPLFATVMTAGYTASLMYLHYPFGAFKVLVFTWFALAYAVAAGAEYVWEKLADQSSKWILYTGAGVGIGLLLAICGSFFLQEWIFYDSLIFKSVREFKKVSVVENLAPGQPVAMIVNDTYANLWASHFLRKTKLYFANQYRGYMAGKTVMDRSEPVDPADIRFVVTDNPASFKADRLLSRLGPYYVWDCGRNPWALVTEIDKPEGIQGGGDTEPFAWRGHAELQILSRTATPVIISAQYTLAAGAAQYAHQRVQVEAAGGFEEDRVIGNGMESFAVPLQPGMNHILMRSVEKVPVSIGMARLSLSTSVSGDKTQVIEIENPNGIENWDADQFFWVGPADTTVTVSAAAPGTAQLRATLVAGPSLIDKAQARLLITSPRGAKTEQDLDWGTTLIDIPVNEGPNKIVMHAIGGNVAVPGDPRIMMIGFRNLQSSYIRETSKK